MPTNDLSSYMMQASETLQREYERIQKRATEDPGTAGDNGEENWAGLLREWVPSAYHVVTKGRIMSTTGECGPQVDVLVLSPSYPKALINRKEYLAAGVVACFECKLTLKADHISSAVKNAAAIQRLCHRYPPKTAYGEVYGPLTYGLLAHSHSWKAPSSRPIHVIDQHLRNSENAEAKHPRELLDVICISDLATWTLGKSFLTNRTTMEKLRTRINPTGYDWPKIDEAGGLIETIHFCHHRELQQHAERMKTFTPIGTFLCNLLGLMAWRDPSLRPLAEYFIGAAVSGSGEGSAKGWPLSVVNPGLREKLLSGGVLTEGPPWSEWTCLYF